MLACIHTDANTLSTPLAVHVAAPYRGQVWFTSRSRSGCGFVSDSGSELPQILSVVV